MKIRKGDCIYLQNYDLAEIIELENIPNCITSELFGGCLIQKTQTPQSSLRFKKFAKKDSIDWISQQEWILDYESYAKKDLKELKKLKKTEAKELKHEVKNLTAQISSGKPTRTKRKRNEIAQKRHKILSIKILIGHLKKKAVFELPEE